MRELKIELNNLEYAIEKLKRLISNNTSSFEKNMIDSWLTIVDLQDKNRALEGRINSHCMQLEGAGKIASSFREWGFFLLKQENEILLKKVENEAQKHYLIESKNRLDLAPQNSNINEDIVGSISSQHKKNLETLKYLENSSNYLEKKKNKLIDDYKKYEILYENKVASMGLNVRLGKNVYEALYSPDIRALNQYTQEVLNLPFLKTQKKKIFYSPQKSDPSFISRVTETLVDAFKKTPSFSVPKYSAPTRTSTETRRPRPNNESPVTFRIKKSKNRYMRK